MRPSITLGRAAGVCLCVFMFSGSAFAGPGNGNGGTPPGQEKKAEQQAPAAVPAPVATAQAPAPASAARVHAAKAEPKATAKAKVKAKVKVEHASPAKPVQAHAKATPVAKPSGSQGRSAEAHHHVIVCHRTGSASNPYVVINIPWTAWSEAHSPDTGSHPDLDGRHDILLRDPASRPGSKDGFSKSSCGAPAAAPPSSGSADVCPNLAGHQATVPAGTGTDAQGNCVVVPQPQAQVPTAFVQATPVVPGTSTPAPAATEQKETKVVAATSTKGAKMTKEKTTSNAAASTQAQSGVLAASATSPQDSVAETATSGTLPFTGLPLWLVALVGAGLLAAGFVLRRGAQH